MSQISPCNRNESLMPLQRSGYFFDLCVQKTNTQLIAFFLGGGTELLGHIGKDPRLILFYNAWNNEQRILQRSKSQLKIETDPLHANYSQKVILWKFKCIRNFSNFKVTRSFYRWRKSLSRDVGKKIISPVKSKLESGVGGKIWKTRKQWIHGRKYLIAGLLFVEWKYISVKCCLVVVWWLEIVVENLKSHSIPN